MESIEIVKAKVRTPKGTVNRFNAFGIGGGGGGEPGKDGGYYIPSVTKVDANTIRIQFAASEEGMMDIDDVYVTLPKGNDGDDGGYYYPSVSQVSSGKIRINFTASDPENMPEASETEIILPKGDNGKTPIKGQDYYTEAEKTEMVSAVLAALPKYNGEVQ